MASFDVRMMSPEERARKIDHHLGFLLRHLFSRDEKEKENKVAPEEAERIFRRHVSAFLDLHPDFDRNAPENTTLSPWMIKVLYPKREDREVAVDISKREESLKKKENSFTIIRKDGKLLPKKRHPFEKNNPTAFQVSRADDTHEAESVTKEKKSEKRKSREENLDTNKDDDSYSSKKYKKEKAEKNVNQVVRAELPHRDPEVVRAELPHRDPELPDQFKRFIEGKNGSRAILIIEKTLFNSDVSQRHSRLSIPLNALSHVATEFLTAEEVRVLNLPKKDEFGKKVKRKIPVVLIDPNLAEYSLNLTKWVMPKAQGSVSETYNLVTKWNSVWRDNGLEEGMNPSKEGRRQGKFFQKLHYALFCHLVPLLISGEPSVFIKFVFSFVLDIPESISTGYRSAGLKSRGSCLTPKGRSTYL
ncbi:hypothetical protein RJ640_018161 [Escallonia rubra]|uniref:Uncharacterized protein n=1 Tax=Escallonia rubra TaxID=112253 RepID=A0AA88S1J6_9ASTE|nr:hypothetical protein RJ640_018161 [Escallonia rubra]